MFSPNIHPATFTYTPVKKNSTVISRNSDGWLSEAAYGSVPSTPTTSPKHIQDSNRECQILLLNALKGDEQNYETRQNVIQLIESMDDLKRVELADFLFAQNGIVASTLENNACKHFECSSDELNGVLDDETVDELIPLWKKIYLQILPNFLSMVYILENFDSRLQIRQSFLTLFRDKVLMKVLSKLNYNEKNVPKLYTMLFITNFFTENNSKNFYLFKKLMNSLLNIKTNPEDFTTNVEQDCLSPLPRFKHSILTTNKRLNRQSSEITFSFKNDSSSIVKHTRQTSLNLEDKNRSNTLPINHKRSVHFDIDSQFDDNSTVNI